MIANMTITNSPRAVKKQGYGITPYDGTGEVFGIIVEDLPSGKDGQVFISGRVKVDGLKENEYYYADNIGLLKTEGSIKVGFYSGGYLNLLLGQGSKGEKGDAGYTPIKGVDYFDGAKGEQGDVSLAQLNSGLATKAPAIHGHDYNSLTNTPDLSSLHTHANLTALNKVSGINTGDQDLSGKQDVLVSGTNIKTINGTSLLGVGNVVFTPDTTITSLNGTLTSGDVTMTNANTFYDGASITLTAGTWLVIGFITLGRAATVLQRYTARISDGTTHYASSQMTQPSQNPHYVNISMATLITVNQNTVIKLQGASTSTNCLIKRACADNASGNNATQINAIKLI